MTTIDDDDFRNQILTSIQLLREEKTPAFPTNYAAAIYVALGTVKLMHEAVQNANASNPTTPVTLDHISALATLVDFLKEVEEGPSLIHTGLQ